ncbi:MauE/DoxX family redox-associated membrane protein [Mariniblastus fucicola]|uniref:DoxX n=1 Tax=Mariniblastus fucicola TaxID=980251 RepID=A0A5B9PJQ8_9BACT|nr:hypothetical protein [Mariniblastus fucicola]QEG24952.1 hypothetical protein MFFC18_48750 [Mariniblastus fucicola]
MNSVSVNKTTLQWSLLLLRLGVFLVFAMWTLDKFINPGHAAVVFEKYYKIPGMSSAFTYAVGGVQVAIILLFASGTFRTWSYAAVTILHAVSTFSAYNQYLDPWTKPNLLFFAAFPMLAACLALWLLREHDNMLSIDAMRNPSVEPRLSTQDTITA